MMDMANKLDSRADYIRKLTQSLANPNASASAPATAVGSSALNEGEAMGDDIMSIGGDTVTSVLYKYGKEASIVDQERSVRSSGSFSTVGIKGLKHKTQSSQSFDGSALSEMKSAESLAREGSTVTEDPHVQFMINKEQNSLLKGKGQKLVSGSQFRNITKLGGQKCEQCYIFDRVNKKHKETIRGLRLQIARLEEQNHDLKRYKGDSHHILLKPLNNPNSNASSSIAATEEDDENNMEDIEFLINKCETYENDLAKMKKMLLYERNLNEGLRKTLDETRTSLREELTTCQESNARLTEDFGREKARREVLQASCDESTGTIMRYKQQLDKAEAKLSDCLLQLSAVKSNMASVDHLKEIERLKGALTAAEGNIKTLTAQLTSKEMELNRVSERLVSIEGQVHSLEERRAAAEAQLHRTQNEIKEAHDVLVATKKQAAVVQDTLNIAVKEKDTIQRNLAHTEHTLEQSCRENAQLHQDIIVLNTKLADLLKKMAREDENTKKALEKAITASVRLCVVAPTVNVHVSDKKLKFKAGLTQDALKSFLSKEVLEKYSFLFKQKNENSAPDGSNLEPWLQTLLGQMQTSIEQHVSSAMDGSSM